MSMCQVASVSGSHVDDVKEEMRDQWDKHFSSML